MAREFQSAHLPFGGKGLKPQQRALLRSQGRCFKCHKQGHISKNCITVPNTTTRLDELPVELLELICGFVITDGLLPWVHDMLDFRFTCRAINAKTYDFFGRAAFGSLGVQLSYRGLSRLAAISQCPRLAEKVQRICLFEHDRIMENEEYEEAQKAATSNTLSRKQRRAVEAKLWLANAEQSDKAFVERSATDGIMLTLAFLKLPNLSQVLIRCVDQRRDRLSIRQIQTGEGPSTTRIFSMTVSSLAHAQIKPRELLMRYFGSFKHDQGVSLQALSMPRQVLECLSELRRLDLWLETRGNSFKRK